MELSCEVYYPSEKTKDKAHIKNRSDLDLKVNKDYEGFWADIASELHWFKKWENVMDDSGKPFYKWFTGGETNISY